MEHLNLSSHAHLFIQTPDIIINIDELSEEYRDKAQHFYAVRLKDSNEMKTKLFQFVDLYGDKIIHITKPVDNFQLYMYVKSEYVQELFSYYTIPDVEFIRCIRFRDYFTLDRFPKTLTIYCKSDYIFNGQFKQWIKLNGVSDKITLITGSSDYEINQSTIQSFDNEVKYWFGMNMTASDRACCIPIGLTSFDPRQTDPSFLFRYGSATDTHKILATDTHITDAWKIPKTDIFKVYMNFSANTFRDRKRIWTQFKDIPWIHTENYNLPNRETYFKDLRKSEYSLCPRGNGIDTHRFWESLYSGVIPIIEKDKIHEFFKDLPFLEFDKLTPEIVTEQEIEKRKTHITFNYHKLYCSYWIEQIERKSILSS